ncbi:MAG: amidohydrolase [bacterium]|nr:amidohydrolase [bacterium]
MNLNHILITNVRVYRKNVPLFHRPRAVEIKHGRFVRFFDEPYPNIDAEVIDGEGSFLYPGFFDSHTHFVWGGSALGPLNFSGVTSLAEMRERLLSVREGMESKRGRGWMIGLGLDQNALHPTREQLDEWCGSFPVIIETKDLHSAIVNRAALELASLWNPVTDPEGGKVERDGYGIPNGWLREFAVHNVKRYIPPATPADYREWFEAATELAHANGIIGVGENADCELAKLYWQWAEAGALPIRIDLWLNEGWPNEDTLEFPKYSSDRLRIATQKLFLDGSLGSHTAWFREPYTSRPDTCGMPLHSNDEVYDALRNCLERNWGASVHTIGDASCEQLLFTAEKLQVEGFDTSRIAIEHLQVMTPDTPQRVKKLGMIASMQPIHLAGDREWMEARIGKERCENAFAFHTLSEEDVRLRFGSDWPVEDLNPIAGLRTAILRTGYSNCLGNSWYAKECIPFETALAAFSSDPHHLAGWSYAGKTTEEAPADFILLDQDLSTTHPADWDTNSVKSTWVGGAEVFHR